MAYIAIWRAKESVNCEAEEQSQKTAQQVQALVLSSGFQAVTSAQIWTNTLNHTQLSSF